MAGADYEGISNQTTRFWDWMTTPDANTCQAYTVDIMINGAAPQGGDGFVLANGQGCTSGTTQNVGIALNATNVKLGNIHTEQKSPALAINYAPTCSAYPCLPFFYESASNGSNNIVIDRMDSNCAIGAGCSDGVLISNAYFSAPYKVDLRDMNIPASQFTYNLRDQYNGNTFTPGTTPSFDYKLDSAGYPIVVANCSQMTKGKCSNNGIDSYYVSGAAGTSLSASGITAPALTDSGLLSKTIIGTNSSGQLVDDSNATLSNNTTGTAANLSGTPLLPNGTTATTQTAGDNSTKLATTAYVRSESQLTWSCSLGCGTGTGTTYCQWTLPASITVTQLDMATAGAVGCSTWPTFQLWDAKANVEVGSYSVTFSTNDFYNVTGSTNVASGEQLRMKVVTGASGCSTNPSAIVATVTYQMQN